MTDSTQNESDPFSHMDLETAIRLRWVLRDIRAGRLNMCPASTEDLEVLAAMGLIEIDGNDLRISRDGQFAI